MRERSEIAGCANGSLRRNYGMNFIIQHVAECLYNERAHATKAFGQRIRAKKDHATSFCAAEWFTDPACMRPNEIHLKLADLLGRDANAGEFAKTGVDAICGFAGSDKSIHNGAGSVHALDCRRRERHSFVIRDDGMHLLEG